MQKLDGIQCNIKARLKYENYRAAMGSVEMGVFRGNNKSHELNNNTYLAKQTYKKIPELKITKIHI